MSDNELLWFLFSDSFFTNLAFILDKEIALWTIINFHQKNIFILLIICFISYIFSNILNYFLGCLIRKIIFNSNENFNLNKNILKNIYDNFGIIILFMSFLHIIGNLIILFAGMLRYRPILSIFISSISKILYNIYLIYL